MAKQKLKFPENGKKTAGRRPGPVEDIRSERLVTRMHPDLFQALTSTSKIYGISRSQYVERILIDYHNRQMPNRPLDMTGRFIKNLDDARILGQPIGSAYGSASPEEIQDRVLGPLSTRRPAKKKAA